MRFTENYYHYSATAIKQVIEQAVGKPVNDEDGKRIGVITSAKRTGIDSIEFEAEVLPYES